MKIFKTQKITVFLCVLCLAVTLAFATTVNASAGFVTGDKFYYGSYPQSKVTDSQLISTLNNIKANWTSYNYFEEGKASDFMKYKDVSHNGNKYRGVIFTKYRPNITYAVADAQNSYQDENGYEIDTVYWFKYEPIEWKVLYPSTGLAMSSIILDSQAYLNNFYTPKNNFEDFYTDSSMKYYANNYEVSDIRKWLSNDFINTAFSQAEQEKILLTNNLNLSWKPSDPIAAKYNANETKDKIYLLTNGNCSDTRYGFPAGGQSAADRQFVGTDYARAQGLGVYKANQDVPTYSFWWSRTAGDGSFAGTAVDYTGASYYRSNQLFNTFFGVVPVMCIDLTAVEKIQ